MRTILLFAIIGLNSISTSFSQTNRNKVSIDPVRLFLVTRAHTNIQYERGFHSNKLGISFFYGRTNQKSSQFQQQKLSLKRYARAFDHSSFWHGLQVTNKTSVWGPRKINSLGLFGELGYQFVIRAFYLDFSAEIGYLKDYRTQYIEPINKPYLDYNGVIKTGIVF